MIKFRLIVGVAALLFSVPPAAADSFLYLQKSRKKVATYGAQCFEDDALTKAYCMVSKVSIERKRNPAIDGGKPYCLVDSIPVVNGNQPATKLGKESWMIVEDDYNCGAKRIFRLTRQALTITQEVGTKRKPDCPTKRRTVVVRRPRNDDFMFSFAGCKRFFLERRFWDPILHHNKKLR
ncbi:MAG: hypothetical protein H6707_14675 [Deltaproteobacteria bacterium]|nr:hypothetical protein [Deltaproteobacteria bacterium]